MFLKVERSNIRGTVSIPGSKSHTIRALFFASLAQGKSEILNSLFSSDAVSARKVCSALGAEITNEGNSLAVQGFGGIPKIPEDVIDVGNSGTTLRFAAMTAALCEGYSVFTGDYQIRRRPLGPLLDSINDLGGFAVSAKSNGMAPVVIKGRVKGGQTKIDSVTSQYLSSLLINLPLAEKNTEIEVTRLNEVPYVEMTTWWLDRLGIRYKNEGMKKFYIPGSQVYKPFKTVIPGDFSSATFFMVLAAISGGEIHMENLDMGDVQGDKLVLSILKDMGTSVAIADNGVISIKGGNLKGREIDMNAIPDALPAMAVAGCFAEGETRLVNVPQARLKETDRIHVMCTELSKMGADIRELPDGLVIRNSKLTGCPVEGHDDHRVVMALAVAGMNADNTTSISTAEAMNVTFPEFVSLAGNCGGKMKTAEEF